MDKIAFTLDESNINIVIPIDVLKWAGENNPECPIVIHDDKSFAKQVMFELENNLGSMESGLTGFEELLDKAMQEVAEGGFEFVDLKEVTYE